MLSATKKARTSVDTQETQKEIKPVVIDYGKVQSKVLLKYDYWHRELLQRFSAFLGGEMQTFYENVSKWRTDLEQQSIDSGATSDAVALITYVQTLKRQAKEGKEVVEKYRSGQKLLASHRYQFPTTWLYAENIEGEWSALEDILHRKDTAIQSQVNNLQQRIKEEDEIVEKRVENLLGDWDKSKPAQVNLGTI